MSYQKFIEDKILRTTRSGFSVDVSRLHDSNMPHQRIIIPWALEGGCRAIFASFGLGKTQIQLEMARLTVEEYGGQALIICPLGVKQEFKQDAERLGMHIEYVRNNEEVNQCKTPFMITNYERVRDGNIDPTQFIFVSLDEASVLRSYGSKTYQEFLKLFSEVKFRYVCTATPSPNKYKELIHYAGFLGIMDTGQALTRFFKRDSTQANNLTLYEHKEREFWMWVSSWAIFITKPSDITQNASDDAGYDLPALNIHWHVVDEPTEEIIVDDDGSVKMFADPVVSLSEQAKEKRVTASARLMKAQEIISVGDEEKKWLIWHHLEYEREMIEKRLQVHGDVKTVYGSQDPETKEELLIGFAKGEYRILATKPEIAGQGCNFQRHCHSAIFMGIDDKFNDFIQAIHRIQRFQQSHTCDIHIIYSTREERVRKRLEEKWKRHYELVDNMVAIIKEYGLSQSNMNNELRRSIGIERKVVTGKYFTAVNNDCVVETQGIESNRFGMIITSIPFSNHYEYTPSYNDFGHTNNDDHFLSQMDYLTPELLRVLQPGRVCCVHVKDRILFGNVTGNGMPTVNPFHAKTIFHYIKHGFVYMGMITIETDVVRENNQTYRLGWTEQCKDGSKMGVGSPEYLLIFRKLPSDNSNAYADEPVKKSKQEYTRGRWQIDARAKWNSSGNRLLTPAELALSDIDTINTFFTNYIEENVYDYRKHVEITEQMEAANKLPASFETLRVPERSEWLWSDVVRMKTLNSKQTQRQEQNHICPFQIDVVERAVTRWSNEGDEIYDPFGGIMTTNDVAIKLNRRGYCVELNPDYFRCGVGYSKEAEHKRSVPNLFDLIA